MLGLFSCTEDVLFKGDSTYCVEYIPSQCAPEHSGVLGLKDNKGKYWLISNAESISKFDEGDRVVAELEEENIAVCFACNCPSPEYGGKVISIRAK